MLHGYYKSSRTGVKVSLQLLSYIVGLTILSAAATTSTCGAPMEFPEEPAVVSTVELRRMQTRRFDTTDKTAMVQNVVSTLQDMDYVVDQADVVLGVTRASKSVTSTVTRIVGFRTQRILVFRTRVPETVTERYAYQISVSVTVRPRGETQLLVRANMQHDSAHEQVDMESFYQDFFASLSKSMFLEAHQVD